MMTFPSSGNVSIVSAEALKESGGVLSSAIGGENVEGNCHGHVRRLR